MNQLKFLPKLAIAGTVAAIGSIGFDISPAQAGKFVFQDGKFDLLGSEWCEGTNTVLGTCAIPGSSTSPNWTNTFPGRPPEAPVYGFENPLIHFESDPGFSGATIKVEYFGSGDSTDTNLFKMFGLKDSGVSWCSPSASNLGSCEEVQNDPDLPEPFNNMSYENVGKAPTDWQGTSTSMEEIWIADGPLDFAFLADAITNPGNAHQVVITNGGFYPNGCAPAPASGPEGSVGEPNNCGPDDPDPDSDRLSAAHYFGTFDGEFNQGPGTFTTMGEVVYLGLSDEEGADDDSEDFWVRLTVVEQKPTKVPEPGTVLGLLAISGLGLGLKRKKQS